MKCWRIRYYFRIGSRKGEYQGEFCGCVGGDTKEAAIASILPITFDEPNRKLTRVTAVPSKKGHYCFTNEATQCR